MKPVHTPYPEENALQSCTPKSDACAHDRKRNHGQASGLRQEFRYRSGNCEVWNKEHGQDNSSKNKAHDPMHRPRAPKACTPKGHTCQHDRKSDQAQASGLRQDLRGRARERKIRSANVWNKERCENNGEHNDTLNQAQGLHLAFPAREHGEKNHKENKALDPTHGLYRVFSTCMRQSLA